MPQLTQFQARAAPPCDGKVVATGTAVDLDKMSVGVDSYPRAQLKADTGISFTNAFGVELNTKSHHGRYVTETEAAALALASVDRTTAKVSVTRQLGAVT